MCSRQEPVVPKLRFDDIFLQLFCEKNSDGTKKLRLTGNELQQRFQDRIKTADMTLVCDFLLNHPEVNEIDLSYNNIGDEGLATLCDKVLKLPNSIGHLNISSCDLSVVGMKSFFFCSKEGNIALKTLRLRGNKLGPNGGHMTALSIPYIPTLEYLDLGNTDQTADSIDCLFLEVYRSNMKVINISRALPLHLFGTVDECFIGESVSELLRVNTTLVEIHVQKCALDASAIEVILEGLHFNNTLRFLDVGYNNICCVGTEYLAKWLEKRPPLLALNIAGNNVKNHGAVALSFGMPFSKLRYLDISKNHITDEGITSILYSIKKPYMLRYFFLWGNEFSHKSNKIINRMLKSKVFEQDRIDVRIYEVDEVLYAARYPVDKYKHRYYGVTDYGCATELKIKRNRVETPDDKPRALVDFKHIDRYPPVEIPPKIVEPEIEEVEEEQEPAEPSIRFSDIFL